MPFHAKMNWTMFKRAVRLDVFFNKGKRTIGGNAMCYLGPAMQNVCLLFI